MEGKNNRWVPPGSWIPIQVLTPGIAVNTTACDQEAVTLFLWGFTVSHKVNRNLVRRCGTMRKWNANSPKGNRGIRGFFFQTWQGRQKLLLFGWFLFFVVFFSCAWQKIHRNSPGAKDAVDMLMGLKRKKPSLTPAKWVHARMLCSHSLSSKPRLF